jgi:hypothetical protein
MIHLDIGSAAALAGHDVTAVVVGAPRVAVAGPTAQRIRGQAEMFRLALVTVAAHHVTLTVATTCIAKTKPFI